MLADEALVAYAMMTNGTNPWSKEVFTQLRYKADGQKVSNDFP